MVRLDTLTFARSVDSFLRRPARDSVRVSPDKWRSLLSPTVSDRKLAFLSGSKRFRSETLISARNAASVKSEPIFEIARNFSEHIPINSEQLVGITRI